MVHPVYQIKICFIASLVATPSSRTYLVKTVVVLSIVLAAAAERMEAGTIRWTARAAHTTGLRICTAKAVAS